MTNQPEARIDSANLQKLAANEWAAMYALEKALADSGLEPSEEQ
jgi:hypothetical protein